MLRFQSARYHLLTSLLLVIFCVGCSDEPDTNASKDAGDLEDSGQLDANHDAGADSTACEAECVDPTPLCSPALGECVACLDDSDCSEGVCTDEGTCVGCEADDDCSGDSVCATDPTNLNRHVCAVCAESDDCGPDSVCFEATQDPLDYVCAPCSPDEGCADGELCEIDEADPTNNTCVEEPGYSIIGISPTPARVPFDGETSLTLTIERRGDFNGEVGFRVTDAPTGLSAEYGIIAEGETTTDFRMNANQISVGGPYEYTIVAQSLDDDLPDQTITSVAYVVGEPGTLDESFGQDGKATYVISDPQYEAVRGAIVDEQGGIVVGGVLQGTSDWPGFLTRFHADGTHDSDFGTGNGVLSFTAPAESTPVGAVRGGFLAHIERESSGSREALLRRYSVDGQHDTGWADGGEVMVEPLPNATHVARDRVLMWESTYSDTAFELYDRNGPVSDWSSYEPNENIEALTVDNQERIVLGSIGGQTDVAKLRRLTPEGELDTTFGEGDGEVIVQLDAASGQHIAGFRALQVAPDGRIFGYIEADAADGYGNSVLELRAFNSDGSPNLAFGNGGRVEIIDEGGPSDYFFRQADGSLIAIYFVSTGIGTSDIYIVRYTASGALDTGFGNNGRLEITTPRSTDHIVIERGAERLLMFQGNTPGGLEVYRYWL